jgi:hypothetical protein
VFKEAKCGKVDKSGWGVLRVKAKLRGLAGLMAVKLFR